MDMLYKWCAHYCIRTVHREEDIIGRSRKGICRIYSPILLHLMTNSIRIPFRYSKQLTYDKEKGVQLFILIIISTDSHKEKMAQRREKGRSCLERPQYERVAK